MPRPKIYKAKNQLDGVLRGGLPKEKYKWKRYEILRAFLQINFRYSQKNPDEVIKRFQTYGLSNEEYDHIRFDLPEWHRSEKKNRRIARAKRAIAKRWEKRKLPPSI